MAGFGALVPPAQHALLDARRPATVSALPLAARGYAVAQLRSRFEALDEDARSRARALLRHWRAGRGTQPGSGVEILLPGGMRVAYDASDLIGFD